MGFVKERIYPDNEAKYYSFKLKYEEKDKMLNRFTHWYVDKDRDIYFIFLGGGAFERPQIYALIWDDKKVIIKADVIATEKADCWTIFEIIADEELRKYEDRLEEIITEAIKSMYCKRGVVFEKIENITFVLRCQT